MAKLIAPARKAPARNAPPAPPARKAPARNAPQTAAAPASAPAVRSPGRAPVAPPPPMPRGRGTVLAAAAPAPRAAAAPPVNAEAVQLRAELATVRAELAKLSKAAARSKGPITRTAEDITEGAPALAPNDWRSDYVGEERWILAWERATARAGEKNPIVLLEGAPPILALLAIPRDVDGPNGWGPTARARGELALHETRNEAGEFVGDPSYVDAEELALIWDHESNGT